MKSFNAAYGREEIVLETGRMAKQASGAVFAKCGGTAVLAAVVGAKTPKEGQDFFPLTVDYREKFYAAGRIPGGFFKREGRLTEKETLVSRVIDRPIRPLFPENFLNEVQVTVTVLSADGVNNPDLLSLIATSAAISISPIPFNGPLAGIRVGLIDGEFIANPTLEEELLSDLDLQLCANRDKVLMIEMGARELSEEKILEAVAFGHKAIQDIIRAQEDLIKACGQKKWAVVAAESPKEVVQKVHAVCDKGFGKVQATRTKEDREKALEELYTQVVAQFDAEADDFNEALIKKIYAEYEYQKVREQVLEQKTRPDGRGFRDIRNITSEISVLPRTHGSSLFTRGQTQSLGVATLGTQKDSQIIDAIEGEYSRNFMLHYNFPSFSVGECKPNRGPGRREIGHGALAERAIKYVLPTFEEFPYVVRLVSEILESNGSSSMASVCSGTLALMDAGVPIKAPVSGIALGLVTDGKKWEVLTDIAGVEDHLGDMDFKVAGSRNGVTAVQLDLKIQGVTAEILKAALSQAKEARMQILDKMLAVISEPRPELSEFAPRITIIKINQNKIRDLIGPGGKVIKGIIEQTGVDIDIQDDGRVFVASANAEASRKACEIIAGIAAEAELGKVYSAVVKKIMAFGAFCEILPGTDGLLHVSEISNTYIKNVDDVLKVGDELQVKVIAIDDNGKISLSKKQLETETEENTDGKKAKANQS